jgi:large subunit ribosomal protein L6
MSRIGKKPITVPKGVTVTVKNDGVEFKGPKGMLKQAVPPGVKFEVQGDSLVAATLRPDPYKQKGVRYTGEQLKKKVGKTGA